MTQLPKRKELRLKDYDYSSNGTYFVTICCEHRKSHLGNLNECIDETQKLSDVYSDGVLLLPQYIKLSDIGIIAFQQWVELQSRYKTILLDQFVIMPNHIHGIIMIENARVEQSPTPTIADIICAYKSISTKLANKNDNLQGRTIWQRSYYEHIIRTEQELSEIREYIFYNTEKWLEDKYNRE